MIRTTIKEIFANPEKFANKEVTVAGWARTIRSSNAFGFIELNDCRGVQRDISAADAKVRTLVIPTNEELMIAKDTASLVK